MNKKLMIVVVVLFVFLTLLWSVTLVDYVDSRTYSCHEWSR